MRDPNMRQARKFGGGTLSKREESRAPAAKSVPIPVELVSVLNEDGVPDLQELETKGLLGTYLRSWNNPAYLKQLKIVAARMRADGVDMKKSAAVTAWAEKNNAELDSGVIKPVAASAQKTIVKTGPSVGRNDPCPCGSKKKFKKCCA